MGITDEIERLEGLRRDGVLSDDEFQQAKHRVLADANSSHRPSDGIGYADDTAIRIHGLPEKTWCTLMHISQLLIFAGGVGIVVPIVLWAISKDESDLARRHGARMMNWLISSFIYTVVSGILVLFVIGIPLLIGLLTLDVVFPVMAAIKANEEKLWSYPMTIKFLDED